MLYFRKAEGERIPNMIFSKKFSNFFKLFHKVDKDKVEFLVPSRGPFKNLRFSFILAILPFETVEQLLVEQAKMVYGLFPADEWLTTEIAFGWKFHYLISDIAPTF